MYLATLINNTLETKKGKLAGRPSYYYIVDVLNRAFRRKEPFKFRFELYEDYGRDDFSVSGLYDMDSDTKYVVLNFPKRYKTFTLDEGNWKDFKFAVSQVCQHEAIHQCQWQNREDNGAEKEPLEFRSEDGTVEEIRDYLADPDEIDAYAHDIAMEIKYFYPKKDPYKVLHRLNTHKKVWSYFYYKRTFKGTDWSEIKNRLYKKTYLWLPYTIVQENDLDWLDITQILLLLSACVACYTWGKYTGIAGTVDYFLAKKLVTEQDLENLK